VAERSSAEARIWGAVSFASTLLQAALNGSLTKSDHPAVPMTVDELARDAAACVAAGARSVHLHPRAVDGRERAHAEVVDAVAHQVRAACGAEISVTTGAWIEPDLTRRVEFVRSWSAPDCATVNVCEEGSFEVMEALLAAGVGVEAGVWTVADAERLAVSGLGGSVLRILVEPIEVSAADATALVEDMHRALDSFGLSAPRLQHGDGEATWVLIRDAVRRAVDTRVGLEDTSLHPNGEPATGNAALVRAARELGAGPD
jgi:uncharacterized protein (DUF849 family)